MKEPVRGARLRLIAGLREICHRRAEEPWLELFHYIVQLYRAYSDKLDEGLSVGCRLTKLRSLADSLGRVDPDSAWQMIDEMLLDFPWQQNDYVEFTELDEWRSRFPDLVRKEKTRLVEIDPDVPRRLRPFRPDGRKVWLVMGGNRTHINGIEWQDPIILHEPLIKHAETAMWRFLSSMDRSLRPLLGDDFAMVGIAPSAIRSRWECRLENFCVTRFPAWSHPRIEPVAHDILNQFGPRILQGDSGSVLSAYSVGCAAAEQLMNAAKAIVASAPAECWSDSIYFAGYVGIRSDLGPRGRLQIVSLMDEAVFGSPDMPDKLDEAISSCWFSSPFTLRPNPWQDTPPDFDGIIADNDSGCGWSTSRRLSDSTCLMIMAGQSSIPADSDGNALLDHDSRMAKTRFGHFLDATLAECIKTWPNRKAITAWRTCLTEQEVGASSAR